MILPDGSELGRSEDCPTRVGAVAASLPGLPQWDDGALAAVADGDGVFVAILGIEGFGLATILFLSDCRLGD